MKRLVLVITICLTLMLSIKVAAIATIIVFSRVRSSHAYSHEKFLWEDNH